MLKSMVLLKRLSTIVSTYKYIYLWLKRYDGSLHSLADKPHKPHHHPNQHIEQATKKNPNTGLIVLSFVYHQPVSLVKQKARNFINIQQQMNTADIDIQKLSKNIVPYFYEIFLEHLVESFPYAIEYVQTNNGSEFTNRLSSRISEGKTLFKVILDKLGIRHKLVKLYTLGYNWQSETFSSQRLIKNFMLNIHFISSMISKSNWWLEIVNAIIFQCVL